MCSGGEKAAGCNRRTQARNAIANACVPVLKTNSVQGVLVFGSREKRGSWEAEELIIRVYSSVVENTSSGSKFLGPEQGSNLGRRGLQAFSLLPRGPRMHGKVHFSGKRK